MLQDKHRVNQRTRRVKAEENPEMDEPDVPEQQELKWIG
jgi:hypothetical protein